MRLIDADALIDELGISDEDIIFEGMLEDAPTIDAMPVVRCKDCKWYVRDKSCETCKHYDKGWDDAICDGCTKAHSNWERKDDE